MNRIVGCSRRRVVVIVRRRAKPVRRNYLSAEVVGKGTYCTVFAFKAMIIEPILKE